MPLSEVSVISQINVDEFGNLSIRRSDRVMRGDEMVAETFHRHALNPGDDLTGQDPMVVQVATAVWTPERVAAWRERVASTPSTI